MVAPHRAHFSGKKLLLTSVRSRIIPLACAPVSCQGALLAFYRAGSSLCGTTRLTAGCSIPGPYPLHAGSPTAFSLLTLSSKFHVVCFGPLKYCPLLTGLIRVASRGRPRDVPQGRKGFCFVAVLRGACFSCPAVHGGAGLPASAEVNQVVSSFPWRPPPPTLHRTASTEVSL